MSSSETVDQVAPAKAATVSLLATAPPGTDILVIDSAFRLVEQGAGRLDLRLPRGLYKVKFRKGTAVEERQVILDSQPQQVSPGALAFSTGAPLAGTRRTHEYHLEPAARTSLTVHERLGQGAQLFLFARAWSPPEGRPSARDPAQNAAVGLSLRDLGGNLLIDFDKAGPHRQDVPDPWSSCNVELAPGAYRLRVSIPELGELEQLVVATAGWQTQLFLMERDFGGAHPVYRTDPTDCSILMARSGSGFHPDGEGERLTELARQALVRRRRTIAADMLQRMLGEKFEHPMLGIYAAHALVGRADSNVQLLQTVVQNLSGILGPHPDVLALALALPDAPSRPFPLPTMLRSSWQLVVERSAGDASLVPAGSLAALVSSALWAEGPWLLWLADQLQTEPETATDEDAESDIVRIAEHCDNAGDGEQNRPPERWSLALEEAALLSHIGARQRHHRWRFALPRSARAAPPMREESLPDVPMATSAIQRMARAMGMPPATVRSILTRLRRKIDAHRP